MRVLRCSPRSAALSIALPALLLLGSGCDTYLGEVPPAEGLVFPTGMALSPDGRTLYALSTNFNARYRVDLGGTITAWDTDALTQVPGALARLGSFGAGLVAGEPADDGSFRLYAAVRSDNSVTTLDVSPDGRTLDCNGDANALPCRTRDLVNDPYRIIPLDRDDRVERLAVTSLGGGFAIVSVPLDGVRDDKPVRRNSVSGAGPARRHPTSGEVYIGGRFQNLLVAMDWFTDADGRVTGTVPTSLFSVPATDARIEARDLVFSPDGNTGWLVTARPDAIHVFDVSPGSDGRPRNTFVDRFEVDGDPGEAVALVERDRTFLYVARTDRKTLDVIDAATGQTRGRIPLPGLPGVLLADPDVHQRIYASLFDENAIAVIDVNPDSPTFRTVTAVLR